MLKEINEKIILAKKSGDKFTSNALLMVKSDLLNNQKTEKPKGELEVVKSYVKKLSKSLEAFKNTDKYNELEKEYLFVKDLLPPEMSEDQVRLVVSEYVAKNPLEKNMGKVMGALKSQLKDVDGGVLSKIVKEMLV